MVINGIYKLVHGPSLQLTGNSGKMSYMLFLFIVETRALHGFLVHDLRVYRIVTKSTDT